jgi:hypothetical protein
LRYLTSARRRCTAYIDIEVDTNGVEDVEAVSDSLQHLEQQQQLLWQQLLLQDVKDDVGLP